MSIELNNTQFINYKHLLSNKNKKIIQQIFIPLEKKKFQNEETSEQQESQLATEWMRELSSLRSSGLVENLVFREKNLIFSQRIFFVFFAAQNEFGGNLVFWYALIIWLLHQKNSAEKRSNWESCHSYFFRRRIKCAKIWDV